VQQEQDYQRRVLQAAPKVLNPAQVNALDESFKQSTQMQQFGIKMAREMMKKNGGNGTFVAPAPPAK
jgi:hypothetical protein